MLRTVDMVYEAGVPVLGVNVGDLGYLTEVEPDPEALDACARDGCWPATTTSTSAWSSRSTSRPAGRRRDAGGR